MINRREFSVGTVCLAATAALGLPGLAWAQAKKPEDGREYRTLDKRVPTEAPAGKVEVIEFFWYSCPHCNAFEPLLNAWSKRMPPDAVLRRVPIAFRDSDVPQQRLFYALEALGKLDALHSKVFQAIHGEHLPLAKQDQMAEWVGKNGVDVAKFKEAYNSFSVSAKARKATQLQEAYQVEGVPALGVAGRYYTDGTLAGNMQRALQIVEYLTGEAKKAR